jgi:membrane-associated phospholipid phosphatase
VSASARSLPRVLHRDWPTVALTAGGAAVLLLAALSVTPGRLPDAEAAVFQVLNGTTVLPFVLVWPVMQLGNVLFVPMSALVAAAFRRLHLAVELLVGGTAAYLAANIVKEVWPRSRPDGLLPSVVIRGAGARGRGFVSGHAATSTALAAVAWPWLGPQGRIAASTLVVVVCLSRAYVGAHLPLDVVGGAGLGLAVGGVVRLLLGAARGHPAPLGHRLPWP